MTASSAPRSPGLDMLRGGAFLLMVAVHAARSVPIVSPSGAIYRAIGEAAPAIFFFAFGITTRLFFLPKSPAAQLELSVLFLFVALAQNILVANLLVFDFFFLLWACQALLAGLARDGRDHSRLYAWMLGAILLGLWCAPYPLMHAVSSMVTGPFPLVPWCIFVLAGFLFAGAMEGRRALYFGSAAIALAIVTYGAGRLLEYKAWELSKWPLSAPFALLTVGASIWIFRLTERGRRFYLAVPLLPRLLEWISRHLLLATTLHFLAVDAVRSGFRMWARSGRQAARGWLSDHDLLVMLILSAAAIAFTLAMLALALAIWPRLAPLRPLAWLRERYVAVASCLLLAAELLCRLREHQMVWEGGGFLKGPALGALVALLRGSSTWVAVVLLVYFTLELQGLRRARPREDTAPPARAAE